MSKKIVVSVIIMVISVYLVLLIPREFSRSYQGVKYKLGDANEDIVENVTIEFKGTIFRTLTLREKFKGTFKINDFIIPSQKNQDDYVILNFGHNDWIMIEEFYMDKNGFKRSLFGDLYMSRDRNKLSIAVMEDGSWNGESGLMISAPATNRKEGLAISNHVMQALFNDDFKEFK